MRWRTVASTYSDYIDRDVEAVQQFDFGAAEREENEQAARQAKEQRERDGGGTVTLRAS